MFNRFFRLTTHKNTHNGLDLAGEWPVRSRGNITASLPAGEGHFAQNLLLYPPDITPPIRIHMGIVSGALFPLATRFRRLAAVGRGQQGKGLPRNTPPEAPRGAGATRLVCCHGPAAGAALMGREQPSPVFLKILENKTPFPVLSCPTVSNALFHWLP